MAQFKEPVFTRAEVSEINNLLKEQNSHKLIAGYDFKERFYKNNTSKFFINAKEKLDGTAKKRAYHEKINGFGWARLDVTQRHKDDCVIVFGTKFIKRGKLSPTAKSAIDKYHQLLGHYLEQAGWQGIKNNDYGQYVIPLNNVHNVNLLSELSPSIGFYSGSEIPDSTTMKTLRWISTNPRPKKTNEKER